MKLINTETNQPIVEFQKNKTIIHSKFLENEMRTMGIPIPHGLRSRFNGQDCVYLDDPLFQHAFREVYYLTTMNPTLFTWLD